MKLALLFCATPCLNYESHPVYVPSGAWQVHKSHDLLNITLLLTTCQAPSSTKEQSSNELVVGPVIARVKTLDHILNINSVNVHLEKVSE